jgi:cell division protein FtsZ
MEEGGIVGARGVLINITGSSNLGIHEVNEACNVIREAAQNHDVQINFGIVMDEAMGDEVKITVIATGFQHEPLPELDRRHPNFPFTAAEAAGVSTEGELAAPAQEPQHEPAAEESPAHDYDTPAFLRKQKRMVQ